LQQRIILSIHFIQHHNLTSSKEKKKKNATKKRLNIQSGTLEVLIQLNKYIPHMQILYFIMRTFSCKNSLENYAQHPEPKVTKTGRLLYCCCSWFNANESTAYIK
jgi:hypothetical protein